ncbi:MAG: hypothetical protein RI922_1001 [Bacteroidota bacterium]
MVTQRESDAISEAISKRATVLALSNKECLARIIRNKKRGPNSECNIYFTYDHSIIREMFEVDGQKILDKWRVILHYLGKEETYIYKAI